MIAFFTSENLIVNVASGLVALAVLVLSADVAVNQLVRLANYFNLSTTFMGMTVVSIATSIPEITAHLTASVGILRGSLDYQVGSAIVLGANIGSDVVQQTLIMGLVVLLAGSLYFRRYFLWKSLLPMIAAAVVCLLLGLNGSYSRLDGLILFGLFVGYTYYLYRDERKHFGGGASPPAVDDEPVDSSTPRQALIAALITLGAMALSILAAQVVLDRTQWIVQSTGIGGSLIGVVTLGVASALPELTTALSGLKNKAHGISLGTLVGSNITNPLLGIGLGSLVSTYWVPRPFLLWDLPWQAGAGIILWGFLWWRKGRIGRIGSVYFIALYVVYIVVRATFFAVD
jgi:cation:H+ antiporter